MGTWHPFDRCTALRPPSSRLAVRTVHVPVAKPNRQKHPLRTCKRSGAEISGFWLGTSMGNCTSKETAAVACSPGLPPRQENCSRGPRGAPLRRGPKLAQTAPVPPAAPAAPHPAGPPDLPLEPRSGERPPPPRLRRPVPLCGQDRWSRESTAREFREQSGYGPPLKFRTCKTSQKMLRVCERVRQELTQNQKWRFFVKKKSKVAPNNGGFRRSSAPARGGPQGQRLLAHANR